MFCGLISWNDGYRLEMFNLVILMSSFISLVFYSNHRCLFDFNNMI